MGLRGQEGLIGGDGQAQSDLVPPIWAIPWIFPLTPSLLHIVETPIPNPTLHFQSINLAKDSGPSVKFHTYYLPIRPIIWLSFKPITWSKVVIWLQHFDKAGSILSPVKVLLLRLAMNIECVSAVFQEVLKTDLETLITDEQFQHFPRNEIRGTFIWN